MYALQQRECKRTAPRRRWRKINRNGKKKSWMKFGFWNVSIYQESIATPTSQSIETPLVQHTIAPRQTKRVLKEIVENKTSLKTTPPAEAHSASLFSSAVPVWPSVPKMGRMQSLRDKSSHIVHAKPHLSQPLRYPKRQQLHRYVVRMWHVAYSCVVSDSPVVTHQYTPIYTAKAHKRICLHGWI